LHTLITSRAPLDIRAERLFALEPLADGEAIQLFVQRAEAVGAGLASDAASTSVYAAICQQLDRLPLAIELIAMRTRTLTPRELLQQLQQPLQALAHGPRDMAPRHQSLRHAIQWSYDLLHPDERRVFRALGVFAGGCTIESAQAMFGPACAVLPTLESLHRASLIQRQHVAEQTRFVMLETIREFAQEQLRQEGEAAAANQRHGEYFARFAMDAYVELLRADAPRWRAWIAAEQDNLRAAFRWAREQRQPELALQLSTGVWRFHWMTGSLREGLEQLETALVDREQTALAVQVHALRAAGILSGGLNNYARARRWFELAVEVGYRLGDQAALQAAFNNLGIMLFQQGELEEARVNLEVSLAIARRAADPTTAKFPLGTLATLHLRLGDHAQAQAMIEESLHLNRLRQDVEGIADALRVLGTVRKAQGELAVACQVGEEALALHQSLNHEMGIGLDLTLLGNVAQAQGQHTAALAHYQHCLALWHDREYITNSALVFDNLAPLLGHMGDPARGVTLSSAAAALRERASIRLTATEQASCDESISMCRAQLSEAAFIAAWATGCRLSLRQAIDLAP
ncbi:MAG: tetratricopeptide repeat protein, partial [Chloroflexaceae bacterium]|nr:tetratricopeptide repeat protein [Chloroflexaceae bacterium]